MLLNKTNKNADLTLSILEQLGIFLGYKGFSLNKEQAGEIKKNILFSKLDV
jgi:hypothetical protein